MGTGAGTGSAPGAGAWASARGGHGSAAGGWGRLRGLRGAARGRGAPGQDRDRGWDAPGGDRGWDRGAPGRHRRRYQGAPGLITGLIPGLEPRLQDGPGAGTRAHREGPGADIGTGPGAGTRAHQDGPGAGPGSRAAGLDAEAPPAGRSRQCPLGSAPPRRGAASPARGSAARCSGDAGPGGGPGGRAAAPPLPLQPPRGLPARLRAPTPQVTPAAPAGPPPAALAPQDEDAAPLLPRPGVRGRRLRALRPALLPRLPAALLPGGAALGRPRVRCACRAQLPGVQPRPRRAAAAASAVPPLRRRLQLGADAGLAPGAGHRRAGVRAAHEPRAHRRLRGGRGGAEHRPRGVAHQRPAAAEEPALLLPAVPGDRLRHLGALQKDEPGERGPHLPGAAEGDGDVPAPADLHPDRGEDGLLRRRLPERDGEEQGEVGLLPEHGLVHHDPGHGAVRAHPRLRHGQRQLLQGEEPHERALPLLREGPAGRVQDVPGARAGAPRRAPLHHRESHLLPLGQEEGHRLHPPVVGGRLGAAPWLPQPCPCRGRRPLCCTPRSGGCVGGSGGTPTPYKHIGDGAGPTEPPPSCRHQAALDTRGRRRHHQMGARCGIQRLVT